MTICMICFLVLVCSDYFRYVTLFICSGCEWILFVALTELNKKKKLSLKVFLETSQSKNLKVNESIVTQVLRQKHIFSKLFVEPLRPPTDNNLNTLHSQTEQLVTWAVFPCPAQPLATLSRCRCPGLSVNSCESLYFFHQAVLQSKPGRVNAQNSCLHGDTPAELPWAGGGWGSGECGILTNGNVG